MNHDQRLQEIRKALNGDERLREMLVEAARYYADTALRRLYDTTEPALMIRQSGIAEGAEKFITHITKPPMPAQKDRD